MCEMIVLMDISIITNDISYTYWPFIYFIKILVFLRFFKIIILEIILSKLRPFVRYIFLELIYFLIKFSLSQMCLLRSAWF